MGIILDLFIVVFDWSPNDNQIFDVGLPKNDHILKAQQPILQQNMVKLLTILFEH